jgi:methionyl-tRNA formyltransferase
VAGAGDGKTNYEICGPQDKNRVLDFLRGGDYELCISAGCPYVLPISSLPADKVYINSHPSALPLGRGMHPINECILAGHKKAGSTVHYLVDKLDAGDIIHQVVFDLTDDVDVDLLYSFIFQLESEVFFTGLQKVLDAGLAHVGKPQHGEGTYYSRKTEHYSVDATSICVADFMTRVRAFSALGVRVECKQNRRVVYSAAEVSNPYIVMRHGTAPPGTIVYSNDKFWLLKLNDGLVRVNRWDIVPVG